MGGFVMGMLCSYLAFTDKGKALTNKLLDNLKQSVEVKEGELDDRDERMDDRRSVPPSPQ